MNDIKWKVLREDYLENLDLKVTLYAPIKCASTICIESEKKAIRTISGSRYETNGIYILKDGKKQNTSIQASQKRKLQRKG